jgi:hypothetical protein
VSVCTHPRKDWEIHLDPRWDILEVRCGKEGMRRDGPSYFPCGELLLVEKIPHQEAEEYRAAASDRESSRRWKAGERPIGARRVRP